MKKYFLIEILKSYFLILISLSLIIWIAQAARYLSLITETGLPVKIYIYYIALIYPKIISQLTILSFLISLFLSILKLQENKELEIFWLSGIGKTSIAALIIQISFIPLIISLFLSLYIVPYGNAKSRELLANSEFSMVNSLVKKNNFNSPLKNLTIFVNKNDDKGNIEKVYIFELYKTIIAKKGRVLNIKEKNYLELIDGFIHEKKENSNNITVIKFEKTLFDFTKYQTDIVKYPKNQERSTAWIFKNLKDKNYKDENLLYEIHKRLFKPLFIPLISIFCCFLLYTNNEKYNLLKLKIIVFSFSIFFLIFLEILLNLSIQSYFFKYVLYFFPLFGSLITIKLLNNFLKKEPIYK